jgi:hypothetical protein
MLALAVPPSPLVVTAEASINAHRADTRIWICDTLAVLAVGFVTVKVRSLDALASTADGLTFAVAAAANAGGTVISTVASTKSTAIPTDIALLLMPIPVPFDNVF